ncbi:MAG: LbtU family siderophore porin [Desulfobacterales bacterium]|nr:LbtU family siderophore porin [Desulfobacterales bacterium]
MKKMLAGIVSIMFLVIIGLQSVLAASNAELEQRIEELEKKPQSNSETLGQISNRLTFSGIIELDYSYTDDSDISDNTINGSLSDLDIGTAELGLEAVLHDYVTANFLLKSEALDSDPTIFWDEAFFTIQKEEFPIYFVGGKRGLPFGLFESLLINNPVTCEVYEIAKTGATVGATFEPLGIDVSATIYKGEVLIDTVSNAGYGFERDNSPGYTADDKVNSYILNLTISLIENLTLATYFNSETGDDERNTTAGISVHYEIAKFIIDGEYIAALNREKHFTDNKEYSESAWFASLGYQIIDPLIAAVRYEGFNDDQSGGQDEHLACRYSIGGTYTLFTKNSFACNLSCEYRKSEYERSLGTNADDNQDEFFAQFAIEF